MQMEPIEYTTVALTPYQTETTDWGNTKTKKTIKILNHIMGNQFKFSS